MVNVLSAAAAAVVDDEDALSCTEQLLCLLSVQSIVESTYTFIVKIVGVLAHRVLLYFIYIIFRRQAVLHGKLTTSECIGGRRIERFRSWKVIEKSWK